MILKPTTTSVLIVLIVLYLCIAVNSKPNYPFLAYQWKNKQISTTTMPVKSSKILDKSDLCLESDCIKGAAKILDKMDLTQNPCEDFYQFACGNYEKTNIIPDEKTSLNIFVELGDELTTKLRKILEEPVSKQEIKVFKQAKELYMICRNKNTIEKRNETPLLELLKRLGGFPALENNWDEHTFYWSETLKTLRQEGLYVDIIVDMSVSIDVTDSSRRRIDVSYFQFSKTV